MYAEVEPQHYHLNQPIEMIAYQAMFYKVKKRGIKGKKACLQRAKPSVIIPCIQYVCEVSDILSLIFPFNIEAVVTVHFFLLSSSTLYIDANGLHQSQAPM
jgi:hypothetical protein